jgi:hypothetical protein
MKLVGMPIKLSATPATLRLPPPTVGEHNVQVLERMGYSTDEIVRFRLDGVIGSEMERQGAGEPAAWGDSLTAS